MASKMKQTKSRRTSKSSPNTAGEQRGLIQKLAENDNKTRHRQGQLTPWEAQKARRLAARQKAGKTFANWARQHKTSERPTVSNLNV